MAIKSNQGAEQVGKFPGKGPVSKFAADLGRWFLVGLEKYISKGSKYKVICMAKCLYGEVFVLMCWVYPNTSNSG